MNTLNEIRTKYPQYNDMSDQEFSDKFHQKFYSDMPKEEFYHKIGFSPSNTNEQGQEFNAGKWLKNDVMQGVDRFNKGVEDYVKAPALGFMQGVANVAPAIGNLALYMLPKLTNLNSHFADYAQQKAGININASEIPYFDVAPHTFPAQAGEAASIAMGIGKPIVQGIKEIGKGIGKGIDYISPWKMQEKRQLFNEGLSQEKNAFNKGLSNEKDILNKNINNEKDILNKDININKEQFNENIEAKKKQFNTRMSDLAKQKKQGLTGSATESENIENLAKRVQFAEKTGKAEALPLREEIYSKEGQSNIYQVKKEELPEGNLEKFAYIIEPGTKKTESQIKALQNAIRDFRSGKIDEAELKLPETYRKRGGQTNFSEKIGDIFGIDEFDPKITEKIEDIISLPTSRGSHYFSNNKALKLYDADLKELHLKYRNNPTLENYDELQSALKTERRALNSQGKIDRKAYRQSKLFDRTISNLDADKEAFMQTLPENLRNVEKEYRTKWAQGPAKYSSEAELTLQRLASGKQGKLNKVTGKNVIDLFTKPDENTMAVIQELGPSVGRHVVYSAINKLKPDQYNEMANTILDLSTKRGFEGFITKDLKDWANRVLKREEKFKSGIESRETKFNKESEKKAEEFKKASEKKKDEFKKESEKKEEEFLKKIEESQIEFEKKMRTRSLVSKGILGAGGLIGTGALFEYGKKFIH